MPRIARRVAFQILWWSLVCWVIVFWKLGYVGLIDDEAHYAELTRQMLQHHSWLVPLLDGAPYIDKPVLYHWLQALSFKILGQTESAARLPSAIAAVLLFVLTNWFGVRMFDKKIGERAWLMLATIPATFVLASIGYLDMLFTAFTFGAVACLVVAAASQRRSVEVYGYVLLVLAVMTKGPVALGLVVVFLLAGLIAGGTETRRLIQSLRWKTGLCAAAIAASPWFVWMYWKFGDEFIRGYVMTGHLAYLTPRLSASSFTQSFYLQMFVTAFFPWSVVTIGFAIDTIYRRWKGYVPPASERLLWMWIAVVLAAFTAARFRVDRYIFPAAPACCLLAARGWLAAKADWPQFAATRIAILLVAVFLAAIGVALAVNMPALGLDAPPTAMILPLTLAIGGIAIVVVMVRNKLQPPPVMSIPIGTMVVVYATIAAVGVPLVERGRPVKQVGQWLQIQSDPGDTVGLYGLDRWEPSLRYYAGRRLRRLRDDRDALEFLSSPGRAWLVMKRQEYERLRASGVPARIEYEVPAVMGTIGRGLRRQVWTEVIIVKKTE